MANRHDSYEVGYGKPPKRTQFKEGQSGNPKGRPKGAKNLSTILHKVGREMVRVNINGRTVLMCKLEASTHQLANQAASGNLKAIREFFYWLRVCTESEQAYLPLPAFDERDKPVMESILKRLRQSDNSETKSDALAGISLKKRGRNDTFAV